MATTWTIAIDWDKNSNYTDTYDDVTSRVIAANWFLGMRQPYQEVADNSALSLTLRNDDRRYSPEYSGSPLSGKIRPLRPVRIQSNDGTTTRTHWTGWIESIQPTVSKNGERIVKILATGPMQFFTEAETKVTLQENKRTDEIIAALLAEVPNAPTSVLDQGNTTLTTAGDNWVRQGGFTDAEKDTFDIYRAIADVTASERGRFFFDREGRVIFWRRHHLLSEQEVSATFNDTMTGLNYVYAGIDQLKNEIYVACQPRSISASSTELLWELNDAVIVVQPGATRRLYVKYSDDAGNRIGARDVTLTNVTYLQGTTSASINAKANGAELVFVNSGSSEAIVQTAEVRGKKITTFDRLEAIAKDDTSITTYGRRTMRINLPSLSSLDDAQYIADFERSRRKDPRGAVTSITVTSHGKNGGSYHDQQLARTLGDRLVVQETQTAHDASYYIIGEAHSLVQGATLYQTTWYLEPAPVVYPWKLGDATYSVLDSTTLLTY